MTSALHTEAFGEGSEATLLLHGLYGSGRNLRTLARRLAERDPAIRAITVDLPGHGQSPPLPPAPTLDHAAAEVLHLVRATGARRLVGHSLGGRVALAARRRDPGAVPDIVLLDIAPGPMGSRQRAAAGGAGAHRVHGGPDRDLVAVAEALQSAPERAPDRASMEEFLRGRGLAEHLVQWLLLNLRPEAPGPNEEGGVVWRFDRQRLAELQASSMAEDLWPVIETAPGASPGATLVVRGAKSPFVSDADVSRLAACSIEVVTLVGAGHFVHVDALEPLVDVLSAARQGA